MTLNALAVPWALVLGVETFSATGAASDCNTTAGLFAHTTNGVIYKVAATEFPNNDTIVIALGTPFHVEMTVLPITNETLTYDITVTRDGQREKKTTSIVGLNPTCTDFSARVGGIRFPGPAGPPSPGVDVTFDNVRVHAK